MVVLMPTGTMDVSLKIITKLYTSNNICCCYNFGTCSASSAKQSLTFLMLYSVI